MEGNDKFHEKVKENKDFVFSCEATDPRLRRFDLDKWNQREVGILSGGGASKITAGGDCSHEIKRRLFLGRKVVTNRDSILKSRDIALPTKIRLVKDMVFSVWSCMDVRVGL